MVAGQTLEVWSHVHWMSDFRQIHSATYAFANGHCLSERYRPLQPLAVIPRSLLFRAAEVVASLFTFRATQCVDQDWLILSYGTVDLTDNMCQIKLLS